MPRAPIATLTLALVVALALAASACGGSDGPVNVGNVTTIVTTPTATTTTTTVTGTTGTGTTGSNGTDTTSAQPTMTYQVWLQRHERLWPVTRTEPANAAIGSAALTSLLAGPTGTERANAVGTIIPSGTKLLGLTIAKGTATVDLSSEYASGGGSLSMTMRLAQVVYTLTQFSTVKRVAFSLDGQPVQVFSGEGITLDRPQTRADYESVLPIIGVASPGFGAGVSSPVTVSGIANVFEANVSVELLDRTGRQLAHGVTTATCGTGCWGTFSLRLSYHVDKQQVGTIVVHDDDAAGAGSFPHEERIPVVLAP